MINRKFGPSYYRAAYNRHILRLSGVSISPQVTTHDLCCGEEAKDEQLFPPPGGICLNL